MRNHVEVVTPVTSDRKVYSPGFDMRARYIDWAYSDQIALSQAWCMADYQMVIRMLYKIVGDFPWLKQTDVLTIENLLNNAMGDCINLARSKGNNQLAAHSRLIIERRIISNLYEAYRKMMIECANLGLLLPRKMEDEAFNLSNVLSESGFA
jgi:hypothetical protein